MSSNFPKDLSLNIEKLTTIQLYSPMVQTKATEAETGNVIKNVGKKSLETSNFSKILKIAKELLNFRSQIK